MLDLYFADDRSNIFKLLVIKEFGIIPSRVYEWEVMYNLWRKYKSDIFDYTTYEGNPDYLLETLDIELIKFIIYENIAESFGMDYWYRLSMENVINSNDTDLFSYVISKIKINPYRDIEVILWYYIEDLDDTINLINDNMLSTILDYMGPKYIIDFINNIIRRNPQTVTYMNYIQLIKFLDNYIKFSLDTLSEINFI